MKLKASVNVSVTHFTGYSIPLSIISSSVFPSLKSPLLWGIDNSDVWVFVVVRERDRQA